MTDAAGEPGGPDSAGSLAVTVDRDGDAVVRLYGELTQATAPSVKATLVPLLRDVDCVVVDISRLELDHPASLSVLAAALLETSGWPVTKLAVLYGDAGMDSALRESGVARLVRTAADPEQARRGCDRRPAEVRAFWPLPADLRSPARARRLLGDRLALWSCPAAVVGEAVQVVSELVTNVVEHADTAMRIDVTLDDSGLHCSVRDHSTRPPQRQAPSAETGYGLRVVDGLARDWGFNRHLDGKTVWALLGPVW